jgi:hypothetical protein
MMSVRTAKRKSEANKENKMLNKNTLADRVKKAKNAKVEELVDGRLYSVKGSSDYYNVLLRDDEKPVRSVCKNEATGRYCQGNGRSVCYHTIAAILARAAKADVVVSFCANRADADRLHRIGGSFHRIKNGLSNSELWFVSIKTEVVETVEDKIAARLNQRTLDWCAEVERLHVENPWCEIYKADAKRAREIVAAMNA